MKFKQTNRTGSVVVELGPGDNSTCSALAPQEEALAKVFNLKRILVATDFSELSKKAISYGKAFVRQFGGELTLLHVSEPYPFTPELPSVDLESIQDAKANLEKFQAELCESVPCRTVLRKGEPSGEIIQVARELEADLIILGTHGRTGLARVLLGGTAEKVVRHAGCPVLVVRERQHEFLAPKALDQSRCSPDQELKAGI